MTTKQTKTTKRTRKAAPAKAKAGTKAKPVAGRKTTAAKRKSAKVVAQLSQRGESLVTFKGGELSGVPNKYAAQLLVLQQASEPLTKVETIRRIADIVNFELEGKVSSSAGTFNVNDGFKFFLSHGLTEKAPVEGPGYGRQVTALGKAAKVEQIS